MVVASIVKAIGDRYASVITAGAVVLAAALLMTHSKLFMGMPAMA